MNDRFANAKVHELVAHETKLGTIDALGRSALHITISANNLSMIEALLECHIDTSIQDKENNTTRFYLDETKCSNNM